MKKHAILLVLALLPVLAGVGSAVAAAASDGHTAAQLRNAGWECVQPPGDNVHCTKAIEELGTAPMLTFRVFSAVTGAFLGTEMLIREDVFKGEPCPTDPPSGQYTHLGQILGLPYYACHRYDSGF